MLSAIQEGKQRFLTQSELSINNVFFHDLIGCDLPLIAPFIISTAGHLCVPFEVSNTLIILTCRPPSMHVK